VAAEDGNTVKLHYLGTLEDGSVFDSSEGREPLEFTLGEGKMIPGFENEVRDMQVGQSKTFTIPAQEAYGVYRDDLTLSVERSELPEGLDPMVGQRMQMQQKNSQPVIVTVTEVTETSITLDANHPLAGKDLTFKVEMVEIS
jgi:peptidylprolyl isomerase